MNAPEYTPEEFPLRVTAALDRLEGIVEENERTIKSAISSLRTMVLQHYHAVQARLDDHARDLARIRDALGLAPLPPVDSPRAPAPVE